MTIYNYRANILELLHTRGPDKTICPSEVLDGDDKSNSVLMEQVRASARTLVEQGMIEFTQRGKAVDPKSAKGPIRLRLKR